MKAAMRHVKLLLEAHQLSEEDLLRELKKRY